MDLERLRREQRQEREAAIRAEQSRRLTGLARLQKTGVLRQDDPVFGELAFVTMNAPLDLPASEVKPTSRGEVFQLLRDGVAPDAIGAEHQGFVQDWINSGRP
jgi:hypothetical protein